MEQHQQDQAQSLGLIPARIERIEQVTPLIRSFFIQADPERFRFRAGQWIDLHIPPAGTRPPLLGGYSLVSAPSTDGRFQLAIKFADHHAATLHLHTQAREGDSVLVTPGQGRFVFEPEMAKRVVLLAAGIGVTPLFSILRLIRNEAPQVHAHLVYSVASRREVLFPEELQQLAREPNIEVTCTVTRDAEDWRGHTGRIRPELLESLALPRDALYYFCGSREFIEDMAELLQAWGIPEGQLYFEKWW